MSDTPEFVNGLIIKPPHEKAPDFVKAAISIKRSELISWLSTKTDDWINLDVKVSKKGSWYCSVNNFKPNKQDAAAEKNQPAQDSRPSNNDFDDSEMPW